MATTDQITANGVYVEIATIDNETGSVHRRVLVPGCYVDGAWVPTNLMSESPTVREAAQTAWSFAAVNGFKAELQSQSMVVPSLETFQTVIQSQVDATARERGYDGGAALAGYVSSTVPAWAAEAQAFIAWRDQVWIFAHTELAKVEAGERQPPESAEGFLTELPAIAWPEEEQEAE